jgi:hypothetical protein
MAVITNIQSRQDPMTTDGATGVQVVKFIDCPRVFIKDPDVTPTPYATKVADTGTPADWTDLGIVNGKMKITYTKTEKEVRTGLDEVLRAIYVGKKTAGAEFDLSQFDDVVLSNLSGLTASVTGSGSAAKAQFAVGSEDVVQKALLLVLQNKLDGKEIQFYHPNAYLSFEVMDSGEETLYKGKANFIAFTFNTLSAYMVQTIYA